MTEQPTAASPTPTDETASETVSPAVVVHGDATPEELAALVAVLTAASGGGGDANPADTTSVWAAHAAAMRRPVGHGPGAWRTSLRS